MTTNAKLRTLVELAEAGSVRGAAERLVVTESSVSSSISALSAEVGIPLITRHGRGIRLTPAGERYAEYARRILGLHSEAVLAAHSEADPEHGAVRIAAVTTAGEYLIPDMLASFRTKHPGVVLRLEVAPRGRVWPMLGATTWISSSPDAHRRACSRRGCGPSARTRSSWSVRRTWTPVAARASNRRA